MVDKKKRTSRKKAIAKPDSVEKHETSPMPPDEGRDIVSVERRSLTFHKGPLPLAKEFVEYKKGHKDAPERILRFMEKGQEQMHKDMNLTHNYIQEQGAAESRRKDKAQWFGFVLSLVILGAATAVAITTDKGWLSVLFVFMALPLLVDRYFERLLTFLTKDKDLKK